MKLTKRVPIVFMTVAVMLFTAVSPVCATAPSREKVKYKGNGKVEVEFKSNIRYKKSKVTVKDSSGVSYKASIIDRDDDELDFKVKNYKAGKTYSFVIKGVKKRGTSKYGTVKGTFKIPAPAKSVSKSTAFDKAVNDAVKVYKIDKSSVKLVKNRLDYDDGKKVYEIEFTAYKNGVLMELDYEILASSGKILERDCECWD